MYKVIVVVVFLMSVEVNTSGIFHENSKISFHPDSSEPALFGYSVLLYTYGLLVGAPKARSKDKPSIHPGMVYNCSTEDIDSEVKNVVCSPLESIRGRTRSRARILDDFITNDMWFGASIDKLSDSKIMICAPRSMTAYRDSSGGKQYLPNGACYLDTPGRSMPVFPLGAKGQQIFMVDGTRKEYGEYGTNLYFYAYGQVGMSLKVTANKTLIIGAPGLLHWTGGIVNYQFDPAADGRYFSKQITTNPYYTQNLVPDDYFGYSVDSGVFEILGQTLFVGGAPRSQMGYGQVLLFKPALKEQDPYRIEANLTGPQLGAYFGASLCCVDIDGDGRSDILVGAPNYVQRGGAVTYDQGAVFVYMTRDTNEGRGFVLEPNGFVTGSGTSGARFGMTMADLGDTDGDGYKDIAIGAPWENDGNGVVYIYRGTKDGLRTEFTQRIVGADSKGFGWSISKGFDVDSNNCNDLVVGAINSNTVNLYRCVPTMQVYAQIKVPDAMNLPEKSTSFTAMFCLNIPAKPLWPHVKVDFKARIIIDPEENRARVSGDSEYKVTATPGNEICGEQTVEVMPTAILSRPLSIKFELEPLELLQENSTKFLSDAARLSEDSVLQDSFLIQLLRGCGEDLTCTPLLVMTWEPLVNPYTPGSDAPLGGRLTILNKEEPAYGAEVHITLPSTPIRVPSECSLKELNMTCKIPGPLERGDEISWEIRLEYNSRMPYEDSVRLVAVLEDSLYNRNITDEAVQELLITIEPSANFTVNGKPFPNRTITVTRDMLSNAEKLNFSHYYEVVNYGPSDWYRLEGDVFISEKINVSSPIKGCAWNWTSECGWSLGAKESLPVTFPLTFDLEQYGELLKENITFNITTRLSFWIKDQYYSAEVTTTLILEPAQSIWYIIVGLVAGLLLLAIIVFILYKVGFFSRAARDKLQERQEQLAQQQEQAGSSGSAAESNESTDSSNQLLVDLSD